jgi:hypothetical protein
VEDTEITRQLAVAAVLAALVALSALVAALVGRPAWAAALGAALVLVYWALELLAAYRAREATPAGSVAVALGGMMARFAVVLGVLIVVGLAARADFAVVALAFLAVYTVYMVIRFVANPALAAK